MKVSALMQPEPPTAADRAALRRPVSMESSSPSKDLSKNSTAPASPLKPSPSNSDPPVPHGGSRARGAAQAADTEPRRGLPGFLGKSSQTPNYQPLSTSEYNPTGMAANSAIDSADSTPSPPWNKLYPIPTPRSVVGASRRNLRAAFNLKEIDVEAIFAAYDDDRSLSLDRKELRKLLKAFIDRKGPIKDDELKFVMAIADKDRDDCISKREILFGLQAWYAFTALPAEVNAALKKYRITADGCRMPSPDELRSLLADLNGFIDVDLDEASSVRRAAIAVGASENRVTSEQMRKAIATWYIHIERVETGNYELATHAVSRMGGSLHRQSFKFFKSVGMVKGQDIEQGTQPMLQGESDEDLDMGGQDFVDFHFGAIGTWAPLLGWLVVFVLPGLYMVHVAGWYPTPAQCEHDLAYLVQTKGYLCMLMGFSGLFNNVLRESRCPERWANGVQLAGLAALVIFIIQDLAGIALVLNSSPSKCGSHLSNVSQLFFVWSLFWFPCLLCCCCGSVCGARLGMIMLVNKRFDDGLHPSQNPGARLPPSTRE